MFNDFARRYFGLFTITGAVLGLVLPFVGTLLQPYLLVTLFVLMFFATAKLNKKRLVAAAKKPLPILLGLVLLYLVVPVVMYVLALSAGLDGAAVFGVVFAALAPTIISAPFFVSMIKGDVEFSYILSVVATLLSPLLIPAILFAMVGQSVSIPLASIATTIVALIVFPALLVVALRALLPRVMTAVESNESSVTAADFLVFTWIIIAASSASILAFTPAIAVLFGLAVVQDFGMYFVVRSVSRRFLPEKLSKALALSVGLKNVVLTAGIAMLFSPTAALFSGIVVLVHAPMFAVVAWLKEKL
jgi:BASS family bile acid:Na+ symporter